MKAGRIALALAIVLIVTVLAGAYFYFFDEGPVSVPLSLGMDYVYVGNYTSRGSQKSITMKAPPHRFYVERVFEDEGGKKYLAAFYNGELRWQSFILAPEPQGLYAFVGREKILVIPAKIKRGMKWQFNYGDDKIEAVAGGLKKVKTPKGQVKAREITFSTRQRTRLKLLVNDGLGIVGINYSFVGEGADRNEADLTLSEIRKTAP